MLLLIFNLDIKGVQKIVEIIVGMSALLTTTMTEMENVIKAAAA